MIYTKTDEKIRVEAGTYTLEVTAENIAVILAGERVALLRPGSAVNVLKADGEIGEDKAEGALTCSFADKKRCRRKLRLHMDGKERKLGEEGIRRPREGKLL